MKRRSIWFAPVLVTLLSAVLMAQAPQGGPGAGGPGGGGGRGGPGGGGGRGGGRGGAAVPPATGPLADAANKVIDAINKQDGPGLEKMLVTGALLADEDGHFIPAQAWATRLTATPKKVAITNLRVNDLGADGGWATFSYTLDEMTAQGAANQMAGTVTMIFKKTGGDVQIAGLQLSVNGKAITPH